MPKPAYTEDLLEKELFGGDSDELDGTGMDVDGMMGIGEGMSGMGDADNMAAAVIASSSDKEGADEDMVAEAGATATAASDRDAPSAGEETRHRGVQVPKLDIELDDPPGEMTLLSHPPRIRSAVVEEFGTCRTYDVLPTMAFMHPYQIYATAAVANMRWLFTGGEDGYIKKWDFFATANGKQQLTQGQRHAYVDSVTKAGVLASYWDHSDLSPSGNDMLSPVYSMDVQSEGMWLASGMKSGRIALWSVRHDEGRRISLLSKHRKPVSVLRISPDEFGLVSGSWDRAVLYWDLNSGKLARAFAGHTSQISSIEFQPTWSYEQFKAKQHAPLPGTTSTSSSPNVNGQGGDSINGDAVAGEPFDAKHAAPVLMTTSIDGQCLLWDMRAPNPLPHSFATPRKTPPWATVACWGRDGKHVYVGRRNNTIDEYDFAMTANPVRTLRLPINSGPVTALAALPNGHSLVCASTDNVRMWDLSYSADRRSAIPFQIIPGHHGGTVSSVLLDESSRFMITTPGNRGWEGSSNNAFLGYEISPAA
ncbi:Transcription factor spt8 [Coemansia sp. RSA 1365]|nr:Transcription factor spt8 [Coemansia sp. RSA 1365]